MYLLAVEEKKSKFKMLGSWPSSWKISPGYGFTCLLSVLALFLFCLVSFTLTAN